MPSQRTDAAHIAPYLTHIIAHHGQLTLVPPDNNGRRRKAKQVQSQSPRNAPREEPVRFSSTAVNPPTSSERPSRRTRRSPRTEEQYNDSLDDIPNYPPPSFLEAISSPSLSVCPSTTTIGRFTTAQASHHNYNSDSDSESDDASLDRSPGPTPGRSSLPSQSPSRGRGIVDPDPDDPLRTPSSSTFRAHRRHLSLSPLRTLFPTRNPRESGHALSAQSTPSTHSLAFSRSSPFFRSTTSLRNLTASTPLAPPSPSSPPSLRSESFLASRRFFSHKGKERATSEALDSWEIVESELPAAPTAPTSPLHDEDSVLDIRSNHVSPQSPVSTASAPLHPLSERDRHAKYKSRVPPAVSSPPRERERRAPPPPPPALAPGEAPPIVTVRTRKPPPPPPPKRKPHPVSSPLRDRDRSDRPNALPELDLERAIRTPLPLTPVAGSPTSPFPLSVEPGSLAREHIDDIPSPTPRSSSGTSENGNMSAGDTEGQSPHHHYPGRPLPRRPRVVVDSTFAPHPDFPPVGLLPHPPSVPEGLLIDLDAPETPAVHVQPIPPLATVSAELSQLTPTATAMQRQSSASSVDLAAPEPPAQYLEVTDLDLLLARLENDRHDGGNYDALWMVSEFIGPATPVRADGPASPAVKTSVLLTGYVEVQRRRTTKDGRVKLKLALLGVAVDRCGICMTQFKKAERARMSEGCKHAFHDHCLARWVVRSRTCPLCRVVLDLNAGGNGCR